MSGCASFKTYDLGDVNKIALVAGFEYSVINTSSFSLASFHRGLDVLSNDDIHIYIEGDGRAWARRNKPSLDPTPDKPLVLNLAIADPAKTIIYLARPCQYLLDLNKGFCAKKLWTSHRYSTEVIDVMDQAITSIAGSSQNLVLIGYSGGGTIAALLAAKRTDVVGLVTIAANLDHESWTQFHQVSKLYGSQNAIEVAQDIAEIPQVHFVGKKDINIPVNIVNSFVENQNESHKSQIQILDSFDHSCCWVGSWPQLLHQVGY